MNNRNIKRIAKSAAVLAMAVLICLTFTACFGKDKELELRAPLSAEPTGLDPQIAQGSDSVTVVANCYEGLLRLNENGAVVPAAAASISTSADGLVYRFKLHENCKWHINSNHEDIFGKDYETAIDLRVTAADFVFGLQRALDPQTRAVDAKRLYMIKNAQAVNEGKMPMSALGVSAVDEYTVQIALEYAGSEFLQILTEPIAMPCNRAFFEATKGKYGLTAATVLCNGPFYLSRWYEGSRILLRRNPDSHAPAKPYSVTFAFTSDDNIILTNLTDGKYAAAKLKSEQIAQAEDSGAKISKIDNSVWGMVFNCENETMKDSRLRIALVKSTDFTDIIRETGNVSTAATGVTPPSCMLEAKAFSQIAPKLALPSYDSGKAVQLYNECTQGKQCEVTILCDKAYETAARRIIQSWQKLFGITLFAKVEAVETAELNARVAAGDYQCAFAAITTDAQTPTEFLYSFKDGGNICRLSSPTYNKLLESLLKASDTKSVVESCMQAQNYLVQNAVICPLFFGSSYYATPESIKNVGFVHSGKTVLFYNVTV